MSNKWIVVANRVQARIFRAHPFALIDRLTNELGREKNRALSTHPIPSDKNPREDAAMDFARRVDRFLRRGLSLGQFDEVLILAEPRMMGHIRESLARTVERRSEWLGKDYCHLNSQQIAQELGLARI